MPPKDIPDRWEPYIPIGSPVRGTRFIALKVPLKEHVCAKLQPKLRWTIDILTNTYPDVGMIVDFTLTTRYYDFVDVLNKGVDYCKVAIPGQKLPSESLVKRFFAAVDFYLDRRRDDSLIGVHCTHGVNRTGYMIARYMIQRMGFSVSDALESITVARGHPIERENYISDLGRHLEKMPKVLDGSDIHRGRTTGEPPRMSLGVKVAKKKKPMEPRTGPSKKTARKRRKERLKRENLKRLRKLAGIQQTVDPCEVVVLDSNSEDDTGKSSGEDNDESLKLKRRILEKGSIGTETVSGVPIKVRNLEELLSTEKAERLNIGADNQCSGPFNSEGRAPDAGAGIRIIDCFSLADERLKNQRRTRKTSQNVANCTGEEAAESRSSGRNSGGSCPARSVDSINPRHQLDPNCTEKQLIAVSKTVASVDLTSDYDIIKNHKAGNENSTLVAVEAKSDVHVAIRVKDISLLTDKSLRTENDDSGIDRKCSSGESISTSVIVNDSTDNTPRLGPACLVAVRVRDISSLTVNPVRNQSIDSSIRQTSGGDLQPGSSGSLGDISILVPDDEPSDIRLAVRVKDISSLTVNPGKNEPIIVNKMKIGDKNAKSRKLHVNCPSNANSAVDKSKKPINRKDPKPKPEKAKKQKPRKQKPNKFNSQLNHNFQNFEQPWLTQGSIPAHSVADSIDSSVGTSHFYSEKGTSSMFEAGGIRNQPKGKSAYIRNKNLDKAIIQEMRLERRKLRKCMRREWKQHQQNFSTPHAPFHYNQTNPYHWRSSQNQPRSDVFDGTQFSSQQFGEALSMTFPHSSAGLLPGGNIDIVTPQQQCNETSSEYWQKYGIASGSISRDNHVQTSWKKLLDSSCALDSRKDLDLNSRASKISEPICIGGGKAIESDVIPATKLCSDATYNPSLKSSVRNTCSSPAIVDGQSSVNTEEKPALPTSGTLSAKGTPSGSGSTTSGLLNIKTEKTPTLPTSGVMSAKGTASATSQLPKRSSISASSSKPLSSETLPSKVPASVASPQTSSPAKLPWTALSDTSWSSLFYK